MMVMADFSQTRICGKKVMVVICFVTRYNMRDVDSKKKSPSQTPPKAKQPRLNFPTKTLPSIETKVENVSRTRDFNSRVGVRLVRLEL